MTLLETHECRFTDMSTLKSYMSMKPLLRCTPRMTILILSTTHPQPDHKRTRIWIRTWIWWRSTTTGLLKVLSIWIGDRLVLNNLGLPTQINCRANHVFSKFNRSFIQNSTVISNLSSGVWGKINGYFNKTFLPHLHWCCVHFIVWVLNWGF